MRIRNLFSAAFCAAMIGAAGATGAWAAEPAVTGDLAKLQGQWTASFGPQNVVVVVTIKGTDATLSFSTPDGQQRESKGEIKIDENAKPEKTVDWINFSTQTGDKAPPNLGIYKLDGDSITICNGGPGRERPSEFKAGEGGKPQLFVLTRKTAAGATAATASGASAGGDLAKLQGRWSGTGAQKQATITLTIKGTSATLVITAPKGTLESKGEIKIDETANPKTFDWVNFVSATGKAATAPNHAIYKLEGDTLTICSGGAGRERPTEFKLGEGGRPSLIVLNRE